MNRTLSCAKCNSPLELTNSDGGVEEGDFEELWSCINCTAEGSISGEASDPPEDWTYVGRVFDNG